ncbi:MAG TPA: glycosyltransferase family protein [Phnomibacter sp.]|nr:glycosyltransferase family protein [Phnomibacter sp.]
MKIFYAVQATGNGHISRALQLMPYLEKFGKVDVMLSGANATLEVPLPIQYRSKGLSLFYSKCGGLDYKKMWSQNSMFRATREAKQLPLHKYDLVINDFDFITAKACSIQHIPSVQFGHQASFMSHKTPRPAERSMMGELILKKYAPATHYVGLHFKPYDHFIYPAVIKDVFRKGDISNHGHITVYLGAYEQHCIEHHFQALPHLHFHWFLHGINQVERKGNITYFPISNELFNESFMHCHGIITGGGFETPAEALYMRKRLLSIPIRSQYEQRCNAAALSQLGVMVLKDANTEHFATDIANWLNAPALNVQVEANNIMQTLEMVCALGRQHTALHVA